MKTLDFDGQELSFTVALSMGNVITVLQRIHSQAFRLSIRYGSSGFEVPELSRSFIREYDARNAARTAVMMFHAGLSINDVIEIMEGTKL